MPIRLASGQVVGTLCAIDHRPRDWQPSDLEAMLDLCALLATELNLREEMRSRSQRQEELRLMARELEHRVKNSFSMIQAVVSLSLATPATTGLRNDILDRVASVASTQELLASHDWRFVTLRDILRNEVSPYDFGKRVAVDGPEVQVEAREAVFVGMIIHELATNAVKYGALAPEFDGQLTINWSLDDEGPKRRLKFSWRERILNARVPIAEPGTGGGGFGSELLHLLVERQLSGSMERHFEPDGIAVVLDFPLSRV